MTEIFVKLRVPGFHHWPNPSINRAYLGDSHRHLFHLEVSMPVGHSDREVEFHDLSMRSALFSLSGKTTAARVAR